ncbi:hypothetical protein ACFLS1_09700, partial [Verrucomicrobiota bacterium]
VWSDAPATPAEYKDNVIRCPWSYGNRTLDLSQNKHLKTQGIENLLKPSCKEKVLMGAGSSSSKNPLSKCGYEDAFRNLAEWAILGSERQNFIGILSCQWHGNLLDEWLPDFLVAADVSWNPPTKVPEFAAQMKFIKSKLNELKDAANPDKNETTPSAWYGVWLKGKQYYELIAPLPEPTMKSEKNTGKQSRKQKKKRI